MVSYRVVGERGVRSCFLVIATHTIGLLGPVAMTEGAPKSGAERRVAPRFSASPVIYCQVIRGIDNPLYQARLLDISQSGVGLQVRTGLKEGELVEIAFLNIPVFRDVVSAVVRNIALDRQAGSGPALTTARVGFEFVNGLTEDQLSALLQLLIPPDSAAS